MTNEKDIHTASVVESQIDILLDSIEVGKGMGGCILQFSQLNPPYYEMHT